MKKKLLYLFISFILGTQLSISQVMLYNNRGDSRNGSNYQSQCTEYLRNELKMFESMKVLSISDLKLSNGNAFVFVKIELGFSTLEDGYVPNNVLGTSSSGVSMTTVRKNEKLTEFHMVVVNNNGEPIKHFKITENFYVTKLKDGYYCFVLERSSQKINGIPYDFDNYFICFDSDGNQLWNYSKDIMAFSMLTTDNNLYLVGEKVGGSARSLVRGIDIQTGKVVYEKVGDEGNICLGISCGDNGYDITEYVRSTNANRTFTIPVETNDKNYHFRKIMSKYNKSFAADQVAIGERYLLGKGFDKDEKEAFQWFQKAANQNNPSGLYQLGKCYQNGTGVTQDKTQAAIYYEKSAELNNTDALLALSNMYAEGDGVEKNISKALSLKEKLAFEGNVEAQKYVISNQSIEYSKINIPIHKVVELARENYKNKNYDWAKFCYERAIDLGSNDAIYEYGKWLYEGTGITKDCSKAIEYLSKLGEDNHLDAQKLLISIYKDNKGIAPDSKQEMYWSLKAANNGDTESQMKLATAYQNGIGVKKDKKLAFEMLRRAAENGNEDAIKQTVLCYALGNGVKKDIYSAAAWSEKMNVEDQLTIARMFYYGEGVKKNMDLPVTIWKRLSEQHVFKAINNMALLNIWGGNYSEAERLIGSIDRIPDMDYVTRESESYYLMGILREAQGRYQQALDCYRNSRKQEAKSAYDKLKAQWSRNNYR